MQIDWITVAAQAVNFLVLVLLLRRFLYGPIVAAMQRREQRIADHMHEAEDKVSAADEERRKLVSARQELERRRQELLEQAEKEAEERRASLENEMRTRMEHREKEWRRAIDAERASFFQDVRRLATDGFLQVARRGLKELANADLEDQTIQVFLDRIAAAGDASLADLRDACRAAHGRLRVESAFPVAPARKTQITKLVRARIGDDIDVEYAEAPDRLGWGIELVAESHRVGWTIDGYLDGIERQLAETLPPEPEASGQAHATAGDAAEPENETEDEDERGDD